MAADDRGRVLALLADVLDYPGEGLAETVIECERLLVVRCPRAAELLRGFRRLAETCPIGRLQELYTGAFDLDTLSDLDATLYPYVGHHLFGESYKRSAFLIELSERYRAHGFEVARELPDHVVVVLRFLAARPDSELARELAVEALVPAVERMTGKDEGGSSAPATARRVYQQLLCALGLVVATYWSAEAEDPAAGEPAVPDAEEAVR
mgnify:CR=1 FL=1